MSNVRGGTVRVSDDWRDFERLDPKLREVLRRAPFNYASWASTLHLPAGAAAARRALIETIVHDLQAKALATYGSDHPQAAPSPRPLAPEWERPQRKGGRHAARP